MMLFVKKKKKQTHLSVSQWEDVIRLCVDVMDPAS